MNNRSTNLTAGIALAAMLLSLSPMAFAGDALWPHARVLIMKGGQTVEIDGVDYVVCIAHNPNGQPVGSYSTPAAALDLDSTITIETNGGTLQGTFGSILNDGIFPDGTFEVLEDLQNGKKYLVFNGTTRVGEPGDWVGTGEFAGVENIIWRCKFELEVDENGDLVIDPDTGGPKLVSCLYCIYTLVYGDVPS